MATLLDQYVIFCVGNEEYGVNYPPPTLTLRGGGILA